MWVFLPLLGTLLGVAPCLLCTVIYIGNVTGDLEHKETNASDHKGASY